MHHQGPLRAEPAEDIGQKFGQPGVEDTEDLDVGPGRVGQRSEDIEDGPDADLAPRADGIFHRAMQGGGKEKANADLANALADLFRSQVEGDTRGLKDIGAAAFARYGPVPVFGDDAAGAGDHEGRGGRDVEGAGGVTAGAAGIDDDTPTAYVHPGLDAGSLFPHHPDRAGNLGDRLTFDPQCSDEGPDLGGRGLTAHDRLHHLVHCLFREVPADNHLADRFLNCHRFFLN